MNRNGMRPIHPGEVLNKEFMEPLGMIVMGSGHAHELARK